MKSILLVIDEIVVGEALQSTLSEYGFRLELANTIEAANDCVQKTQFELVLVDFDLRPDLNSGRRLGLGTEWIRHLRASKINIPILMYSVMEGEPYETASLDAGADDYILSTISTPCLLSRLHAHLRRRWRDQDGISDIFVSGRNL
jgi:DNA-binding response OmpR family regulator